MLTALETRTTAQVASSTPVATPTVRNCAECPFARHLDGNRYICTQSATSHDVVRGHWEVSTDCAEKIEALTTPEVEAIKEVEAIEETDETTATYSEWAAIPKFPGWRCDNGFWYESGRGARYNRLPNRVRIQYGLTDRQVLILEGRIPVVSKPKLEPAWMAGFRD